MSDREPDSDGAGDEQEPAAETAQVDETGDGASAGPDGRRRLDGIIESVLFAAGGPVPLRRMVEVLNGPSHKEVKAAVERLCEEYSRAARGIQLVPVAGGYQFRTAAENGEWVRAFLREKPPRLGRAALETLAVIAYRQPVTRAEIEAIRGVDADSALNSLLSKRLIKISGRKETVGRPLLYATTPEFLEVLGLKDLSELPALREIGPVAETDDDAAIEDAEGAGGGEVAEDLEPGRDQLAESGGGSDPGGTRHSEPEGGDGAGDEGGPDPRPDQD